MAAEIHGVARVNAQLANQVTVQGERFWRGLAKVLACICILQVGVLLAKSLDDQRSEEFRRQESNIINASGMWALLGNLQDSRIEQDKINSAFSDWMVEASKSGGPKFKWNRQNVKPLSTR